MKKLIVGLVRMGLRKGWRNGVLEGNSTWIVIGGAALLAHLGGRALGQEVVTVFAEELKPGESFVISNTPD